MKQLDTCVLSLPKHPYRPERRLEGYPQARAGHTGLVPKLRAPAFSSTPFPECQKPGLLPPGNKWEDPSQGSMTIPEGMT